MIAGLITLTPGGRNEFIDCQKANVRIVVNLVMDVKTCWNSTLELLIYGLPLTGMHPRAASQPKIR
jgi:hypothetical protein